MAQATSAEAASDLPLFYSPFRIAETRFAVLLSLNSQSGCRDPVTRTMLPRWELSFYLFASLGFHFYSFYEVFKVSREHEEELDQEFDLETDSLFGGLKKDPTDFEWSFWMEWGKQRLAWLLLGHVGVSQVANLLARKHRPWILAAYGMWACHCALGTRGTAMVLLHTTISFCVAQFRSLALSWLCSLFLLSTLRLQDVEEVKRGWYETENEYYLLQFTLTVRCLYYTSFSLELCWQQLPAERAFYSFPWMVAYVFYYPVFHNGPILSFPEFLTQMQPREQGSLKASFSILVRGLGRLLFYWWLVELMVHLMYMHAICSSAPLLSAVSCWTLVAVQCEASAQTVKDASLSPMQEDIQLGFHFQGSQDGVMFHLAQS